MVESARFKICQFKFTVLKMNSKSCKSEVASATAAPCCYLHNYLNVLSICRAKFCFKCLIVNLAQFSCEIIT